MALLSFETKATIDEHSADHDIDVGCLEGAGFASVGTQKWPIRIDETIRWPSGQLHRLWTEGESMTTLMIEHHRG